MRQNLFQGEIRSKMLWYLFLDFIQKFFILFQVLVKLNFSLVAVWFNALLNTSQLFREPQGQDITHFKTDHLAISTYVIY
jgi:hypothetical protein